jgi:Ni,Fe-hydrogenase maturation factor
VADLLDAARWRGRLPDVLVLLGLVPKTLELGLHRSPRVEAQVPELIRRIVEEARGLGFTLTLRRDDEALAAPGSLDIARALGL